MKKFLKMIVNKMDNSRDITFLIILFICIISMLIAIYAQFFYRYSSSDAFMLGINVGKAKTEEEYVALRNNFENLFTNEIKTDSNQNDRTTLKIKEEAPLVYTNYDLQQKEDAYFSIHAKIPMININTELVQNINQDIKTNFYDKIAQIMNERDFYTNYQVSYIAFCNQEILSIAVKATLKEGENPERVVIKTYNYHMQQNQMVSLSDVIASKGLKQKEVQKTINKEIERSANNAEALTEYYDAYQRDVNHEMYQLENVTNFLITEDGYVYIIYAYGNIENTNEMDIVIF